MKGLAGSTVVISEQLKKKHSGLNDLARSTVVIIEQI